MMTSGWILVAVILFILLDATCAGVLPKWESVQSSDGQIELMGPSSGLPRWPQFFVVRSLTQQQYRWHFEFVRSLPTHFQQYPEMDIDEEHLAVVGIDLNEVQAPETVPPEPTTSAQETEVLTSTSVFNRTTASISGLLILTTKSISSVPSLPGIASTRETASPPLVAYTTAANPTTTITRPVTLTPTETITPSGSPGYNSTTTEASPNINQHCINSTGQKTVICTGNVISKGFKRPGVYRVWVEVEPVTNDSVVEDPLDNPATSDEASPPVTVNPQPGLSWLARNVLKLTGNPPSSHRSDQKTTAQLFLTIQADEIYSASEPVIRQEFRNVSKNEWQSFVKGMYALKGLGIYDLLVSGNAPSRFRSHPQSTLC